MGVLCLSDVVHAVVFLRMFLLGILIFEGLTARRLYKSFGVKELTIVAHNVSLFRLLSKDVKSDTFCQCHSVL
jgi:hypothetical protein